MPPAQGPRIFSIWGTASANSHPQSMFRRWLRLFTAIRKHFGAETRKHPSVRLKTCKNLKKYLNFWVFSIDLCTKAISIEFKILSLHADCLLAA
jgi:hypothetical protein